MAKTASTCNIRGLRWLSRASRMHEPEGAVHPYETLPASAFWKTAVADRHMLDIDEVWEPKFEITRETRMATFGSCFAQHFGPALEARGFNWLNAEPAPSGISAHHARQFNYGIFSARTGNIYTTSLLRQWVEWALELRPLPEEAWEQSGRVDDPFRPRIEPAGFDSVQEMRDSRRHAIAAFGECIRSAQCLVFTLGLTESWIHTGGYEYPLCPGTVCGQFDERAHRFVRHDYHEAASHLRTALELMRGANPRLRVLLTVSPVPLTATRSGKHVLVATTESKAVLRAAAGALTAECDWIDYFPSYELVSSPVFRGVFFAPNLRNIVPAGAQFVMDQFFGTLARKFGDVSTAAEAVRDAGREDAICDEELLEAFARPSV